MKPSAQEHAPHSFYPFYDPSFCCWNWKVLDDTRDLPLGVVSVRLPHSIEYSYEEKYASSGVELQLIEKIEIGQE